jgi:metal-sulfur cluster biosynthetic enzyme
MTTPVQVHAALRKVVDPCSIATGVPIDLVDMGMVKDVEIRDGRVRVTIRITSPTCWQLTNIRAEVLAVLSEIPGVSEVSCEVDVTDEWEPSMLSEKARRRTSSARLVASRSVPRRESNEVLEV